MNHLITYLLSLIDRFSTLSFEASYLESKGALLSFTFECGDEMSFSLGVLRVGH